MINHENPKKPLSDNITKEESFTGIPVSHGYVIGNCFVMEGSDITYSKYNIAIYEIKKEHKDIIDTLKTKHLNPRTAK